MAFKELDLVALFRVRFVSSQSPLSTVEKGVNLSLCLFQALVSPSMRLTAFHNVLTPAKDAIRNQLFETVLILLRFQLASRSVKFLIYGKLVGTDLIWLKLLLGLRLNRLQQVSVIVLLLLVRIVLLPVTFLGQTLQCL